jgi:hypothetical protein
MVTFTHGLVLHGLMPEQLLDLLVLQVLLVLLVLLALEQLEQLVLQERLE